MCQTFTLVLCESQQQPTSHVHITFIQDFPDSDNRLLGHSHARHPSIGVILKGRLISTELYSSLPCCLCVRKRKYEIRSSRSWNHKCTQRDPLHSLFHKYTQYKFPWIQSTVWHDTPILGSVFAWQISYSDSGSVQPGLWRKSQIPMSQESW